MSSLCLSAVRLHVKHARDQWALTCKQARQTAGSSPWFFSFQEKAQLRRWRKDWTRCWGTWAVHLTESRWFIPKSASVFLFIFVVFFCFGEWLFNLFWNPLCLLQQRCRLLCRNYLKPESWWTWESGPSSLCCRLMRSRPSGKLVSSAPQPTKRCTSLTAMRWASPKPQSFLLGLSGRLSLPCADWEKEGRRRTWNPKRCCVFDVICLFLQFLDLIPLIPAALRVSLLVVAQ